MEAMPVEMATNFGVVVDFSRRGATAWKRIKVPTELTLKWDSRSSAGVDLHNDDFAARGGDDGFDGCILVYVANTCHDDVVGTLGVRGYETKSDT